MISRDDLQVVDRQMTPGLSHDVVSYGDKFYIITCHDLKLVQDPMVLLFAGIFSTPERETYVMEAVFEGGEYVPKFDCGPECSEGVCSKRIVSLNEVVDMEKGYDELVRYLNN